MCSGIELVLVRDGSSGYRDGRFQFPEGLTRVFARRRGVYCESRSETPVFPALPRIRRQRRFAS